MTENRYEKLAAILSNYFSQGIMIPSDVLFFAESTYGMTADQLLSSLGDETFEDQQILFEMIVHPDQKIRSMIEPFLLEHVFDSNDIYIIVKMVLSKLTRVRLYVDSPGNEIKIENTRLPIHHFVSKLYINRQNKQICHALQDMLPEKIAVQASVIIRCDRHQLPEKSQAFLCRFIEKASSRSDDFIKLFELLLHSLNQMPGEQEIEPYLLDQHDACKKMLKEIDQFEKKKDQYSMEYLMMQRYQVPCESAQVVAKRLHLFKIILFDVLGLMPRMEPVVQKRDLGSFKSADDIGKMISSLS